MAVQRNVQFTILVKLEGRVREINFRKRSEFLYDSDIGDERGNRWIFKWTKKDGQWDVESTKENLPTWISDNTNAIREGFLAKLF